VATTAAVNEQYEQGSRRDGDTYMSSYETKMIDQKVSENLIDQKIMIAQILVLY
jgi:hypothetical protein